MDLKPILFMAGGLLIVGGAVWKASDLMNAVPPAPPPAASALAEQVSLIAAARDIPFGAEIRAEDLTLQSWPAGTMPPGAFENADVLLGQVGAAPRRATRTIRTGDVLLADAVSDFGATVTIGSTLDAGARAVAIRVNAETAVGGFVTPGDRVDIVLTEGRGDGLRTGTILQNIRVLATDQNADTTGSAARTARTITVEVSARDAQILTIAQQAGLLSLTLRQDQGDVTTEDAPAQITMDDVWGRAVPVPMTPTAPAAAPRTITVRRGLETSTVSLQ
ncbi:MAG: Flp pilus assembly protein CpaB [Alphaproteobacteria bacterium]|nr:Flp pilus assembly protein CpaB [Alphaproteobacteria bacterium]